MKQIHIKALNLLFFILFSNIFLSLELKSQVTLTDTLHETTNHVSWLRASNDYFSWFEWTPNGQNLYRGHNNNIENQVLDPTYHNCNQFNGLYIYDDFIQMKINDDVNSACNKGFVWEGQNNLIEDPLNIGEVYAQHNHLLFNSQSELINLETNTKQSLTFETNDYFYQATNIVDINDKYIYLKVGKHDKSNGTFLGEAIIKYTLQSQQTEEIFFSTNFLHFSNQSSNDDAIVFTEEQPSPEDEKLYLYDGNQVTFITQRDITNGTASDYLGGVVYVSNDSLFYWNEEATILLSDNAFSFIIEGCKLAWFSGFGQNARVNFYDGSEYDYVSFNGYQDHYSLNFLEENSYIFSFTAMDNSKKYIVRGNHCLNNPTSCNYPDSDVTEEGSYFKVKNLTSESVLNTGTTIYQATESIQLLPGFSVTANASFLAKIEACVPTGMLHSTPTERNSVVLENSAGHQEIPEKQKQLNQPIIGQNMPNPFSYENTQIEYYIPTDSKQASISIFNTWGQLITQIPIQNFGSDRLELQTANFQNGIYHYIFEVDGKIIANKKMVSLK